MTDKGIQTRKTLIQRIKDPNDDFSWEEFYDYYHDYIFVIIVNMGVAHHDAQELLQDILLKAWKAIPNFDYSPEKGKFRWWLCRIAKNTVYTYLKRSSIQPQQDSLENHDTTESAEIDKIIELEWQRFISNKAWSNISTEFSPKYLDAFLALAEGANITEVSSKFDIEEGTLYVYKSRIQKRLCREIAKLNYELNC